MGFTKTDKILVTILLLTFFILCTASITYKSITNDELAHISAGYSYWKTFDFRMNPEHPPLIKLLAGIPLLVLDPELPKEISWKQAKEWVWGHKFFYNANNNADQIVFWSRIPMILVAMFLGVYIFRWASELYNKTAGYLSLLLFLFSPLVIAHSRLVTTDIGVTAFMFITLYYFWRFSKKKTIKNLILTGVFTGLAFSAKFTGIYLIPILGLLAITHQLYQTKSLKKFFTSKSSHKMLFSLIIIFVIGTGILILTYGIFEFPKYITGLKDVFVHSGIGHKAYLLGTYSAEGFWYYFLVAFIFKTPIPTLILLIASIFLYKKLKPNTHNELFLLIPIAFYLFAFGVNKINIGIRHILPIYPFLFLFIGKLSTWRFKYKSISIAILLGWYIIIALITFPHYIPYFNELAGSPTYNILIDSNIDWGQDLKGLKMWMNNENVSKMKIAYFGHDDKDYRNIDYEEVKCGSSNGLMAVSVNRLVGFDEEEHECLAWIRNSIKPIDNIGHSIYIYNITAEQEKGNLKFICQNKCEDSCNNKGLIGESTYKNGKCLCECLS